MILQVCVDEVGRVEELQSTPPRTRVWFHLPSRMTRVRKGEAKP